MRKINVWAVTRNCKDKKELLQHILTIVKDKKQAKEYVFCNLYREYYSPFSYWCELHNKNVDDENVFKSFLYSRYDKEEINKYVIVQVSYTLDQLCSLIRTLAECVPVGASYETVIEIQTFLNKHKKEEKKENC